MSLKEFLQDYGWVLATIAIIVTIVVLAFIIDFPNNPDNQTDIISTIGPIADANFSVEHIALAENQQLILIEVQRLNLFSQCVIDTNSIRTGEVPIDEFGGFRRVSIVTLVCPELIQ